MLLFVVLFYVIPFAASWNNKIYYIAAIEIDWDYTPDGDLLQAAGSTFDPNRRTKFKKAVYREYTDSSYTAEKEHETVLGIAGPVIKGYRYEKIQVHFKNLASRPYSIQVHGGLYKDAGNTDYTSKASEGAQYGKNWMSFPETMPGPYDLEADDAVPPGGSHVYNWTLHYSSGPSIHDDQCIPWLFHSHTFSVERDVHSGPVGVMLQCDEERPLSQRYNKDSERYFQHKVDKEFVVVLQTFDESKSWYADDNHVTGDGDIIHAINGLTHGNLRFDACSGDLVTWWILALGDTEDVHSFTVNGHDFNHNTLKTTAVSVVPGQGTGARMFVQGPGQWLVTDAYTHHYTAGLQAVLDVKDCKNTSKNRIHKSDEAEDKIYYIASEDITWDYAPSGKDQMFPQKRWADLYITRTEGSIFQVGSKYQKVVYYEYTDGTFSHKKPRAESEEYLGMLGPLIKAYAGDNITVVFRNKASRPYSIHSNGLYYDKDSEGFSYNHSTRGSSSGGSVAPGEEFTYHWSAPTSWYSRTWNDCLPSLYHSAVHPEKDVQSGLVGPILICKRPPKKKDVKEMEHYVLFMAILDENKSWHSEMNLDRYPRSAKALPGSFEESNRMHSINGYVYGNMPPIDLCQNNMVKFHVLTYGGLENSPNMYLHGQVCTTGSSPPMHGPSSVPGVYRSIEIMPNVAGSWILENSAGGEAQKGMVAKVIVDDSCKVNVTTGSFSRDSVSLTRTYYIAAVELDWDYAPTNYDFIRDQPLWTKGSTGYKYASFEGAHMGTKYKKVVYREYTDGTFQYQKPVSNYTVYLGIMGPVIKAAEGDTVKVVFRNLASRPYSIHAAGVEYNKTSNGYGMEVQPNDTYTYSWYIPVVESGFRYINQYCTSQPYYSTVDPLKDLNSGLVGQLLICGKDNLNKEGTRKWPSFAHTDRFREFHLLFHTFDENLSWYFDENVQKYGSSLQMDRNSEVFKESNRMHSINGRIYGNLEGVTSSRLSWADFYLLSLDTPSHPHSVTFHGTWLEVKHADLSLTKDTVELFPGTSVHAYIHGVEGLKPGTWMIGSGMADQYEAGMALIWYIKDPFRKEAFFLHMKPPSWYWSLSREHKNWVIVGACIGVIVVLIVVYAAYKKRKDRRGYDPPADKAADV